MPALSLSLSFFLSRLTLCPSSGLFSIPRIQVCCQRGGWKVRGERADAQDNNETKAERREDFSAFGTNATLGKRLPAGDLLEENIFDEFI